MEIVLIGVCALCAVAVIWFYLSAVRGLAARLDNLERDIVHLARTVSVMRRDMVVSGDLGGVFSEMESVSVSLSELRDDFTELRDDIISTGFIEAQEAAARAEKSFMEGMTSILTYDGNPKGGEGK